MEFDSVGIIAILNMSFITTRIVKTWTIVENQITTLSVVKIAIKFSPSNNFFCGGRWETRNVCQNSTSIFSANIIGHNVCTKSGNACGQPCIFYIILSPITKTSIDVTSTPTRHTNGTEQIGECYGNFFFFFHILTSRNVQFSFRPRYLTSPFVYTFPAKIEIWEKFRNFPME